VTITFANNDTIIHKGDGQQFIAMAPDVCKTPSPGGPVPVPYPNLAFTSDLADGSSTVKVEGNPAALASSNLRTSSGDEGGTAGGGILSSKIKGKLTWILYSTDVKFEGEGVVRFLDSNLHNGNMANTSGKNKGKMSYPGPAGDILCDNCGKAIGDPSHFHFPSSNEATREAEKARPRGKTVRQKPMKCAMVHPKFTGVAGDTGHPLQPRTFSSSPLGKNLKSNKTIPARVPETDTNAAGNCAEQKALFDAISAAQQAGTPFSPEGFTMSVVQEEKEWERGKPVYVQKPSCRTCQRVLVSVLCTNPMKE
jgi:hypothetical protein